MSRAIVDTVLRCKAGLHDPILLFGANANPAEGMGVSYAR